jgi:tetratricopeptide (TPR) repeat protein
MNMPQTLAQALGREPALLQEISRIAQLALRSGANENARTLYLGLVAAAPSDAEFNYGLATTYVALERFSDAQAHYDASIKAAFSHVGALAGRGELMLRLGRRREAMADLTRAVAYDAGRSSEEGRRAAGTLALLQHEAQKNPPRQQP